MARIMREEALTPRRVRRFLATTDSNHAEPIHPNLVLDFRPSGPDQLWVADITYIRLRSALVYLAVLLDAWSRRVVGYAAANTLVVRLTLAALNAAVGVDFANQASSIIQAVALSTPPSHIAIGSRRLAPAAQ